MNTLMMNDNEYVVIDKQQFLSMQSLLDDYQDERLISQARADIENGNDELLASDFVEKLILTNENKIKLWRQYRNLSMTELAKKTNINIATISRIESNKREPTLQQVKDLSFVLGVDIDDLVL